MSKDRMSVIQELASELKRQKAEQERIDKAIDDYVSSEAGQEARKHARAHFSKLCEEYVNSCTTDELIHIFNLSWQLAESSGMNSKWLKEEIESMPSTDVNMDSYMMSYAFLTKMDRIQEKVKDHVRSMGLPTLDELLSGQTQEQGVRTV